MAVFLIIVAIKNRFSKRCYNKLGWASVKLLLLLEFAKVLSVGDPPWDGKVRDHPTDGE